MDVIEQIVDKLSVFNNLYDIIRIVDPVSKNTINFGDNTPCSFDETCFTYWKKEGSCRNCVSMRAYLENDTCIKMEYKEDKVYIIIACPIVVDDKCYIAELLKDITAESNISKNENFVHNIGKIVMEVNGRIITDSVSGAYNNNYLHERLVTDINESITESIPISVIALDIDLFSEINQQYGVDYGNQILKEVAQILLKCVGNDKSWVARYEKDLFVIVLNNSDLENSNIIGENLRRIIENTTFSNETDMVRITASLSVCQIKEKDMDIKILLRCLRDGLHQAKVRGRNNIMVFDL